MINVQYCPCGHVDVTDDPELVQADKERAAKGYIDALTRPSSECEECNREAARQRWLHAAYGIDMEDL